MDKQMTDGLRGLSDEQMDGIAGGLIIDRGEDYDGEDRFVLVTDKEGKPILYADNIERCIVQANGGHKFTGPTYDTTVITPEEYEAKFGRKL